MKLKHRLALFSILTFTVIIAIFATIIYFAFSNVMIKKELQSLESKTVLAAIFYLEKDELPTLAHEDIRNQLARSISRKNIAVFNAKNTQVYGEMNIDKRIDQAFIEQIRSTKRKTLISPEHFYNGIFYKDNQGEFVVVARESKYEFNLQLESLLKILIIVSLISLVFVYFFSYFLGFIAYKPIHDIIQQIKNRNSANFQDPLFLNKTYAEVEDLKNTYNVFIEQIAQSFSVQKNFIDYVSHELRSPITALLGTLEVTKQKDRSQEEYQATLTKLSQYTHDLQDALDQMMLLSGAKTSFEKKAVRIDEIVWQVVENAILYQRSPIDVRLEVAETKLLNIQGNDKLLALALSNIISNAIKYSDNQLVTVIIKELDQQLLIQVLDTGIGILSTDVEQVKHNFYRGQNTKNYQGKGIGLSMANLIFNMHQIELKITANQPKGTQVALYFRPF